MAGPSTHDLRGGDALIAAAGHRERRASALSSSALSEFSRMTTETRGGDAPTAAAGHDAPTAAAGPGRARRPSVLTEFSQMTTDTLSTASHEEQLLSSQKLRPLPSVDDAAVAMFWEEEHNVKPFEEDFALEFAAFQFRSAGVSSILIFVLFGLRSLAFLIIHLATEERLEQPAALMGMYAAAAASSAWCFFVAVVHRHPQPHPRFTCCRVLSSFRGWRLQNSTR
jgi:hypothetical protein